MPRYFLEVGYKGTAYHGFQVQDNAPTIQFEIQKAMKILLKEEIVLTGSSRTDAGVHALQNFFQFEKLFDSLSEVLYLPALKYEKRRIEFERLELQNH